MHNKAIYIILTLSIFLMSCNTPESGKEGTEDSIKSSKPCKERKYHNISFCTSSDFELKEIEGCIDSDCITFVHNGDDLDIDISPYAGEYSSENRRKVLVIESEMRTTGITKEGINELKKIPDLLLINAGEPSDKDYYGHNAEFRREGDYYVKFKYPRSVGYGYAVVYGAIYWEDKLDYVSCFSIACKNPSKETIQFMREIFESIEIKDPILL